MNLHNGLIGYAYPAGERLADFGHHPIGLWWRAIVRCLFPKTDTRLSCKALNLAVLVRF